MYTPNAQLAGTARNVTVRHLLISAIFIVLCWCFMKERKKKEHILCEFLHPKKKLLSSIYRERSSRALLRWIDRLLQQQHAILQIIFFFVLELLLKSSTSRRVRKRGGLLLRATLCSSTCPQRTEKNEGEDPPKRKNGGR